MIGIDTNVLVRYLVADHREQARRVNAFLKRSRTRGEAIFVSVIVLCETVWVPQSVYGRSKHEILTVIEELLGIDVFQVEAEDTVGAAVKQCRAGKGGFVDHLIGELDLVRGCRETVTFDGALRHTRGFGPL